MKFVSEVKCAKPEEKGYLFIFYKGKMLYLEKEDKAYIPHLASPAEISLAAGSLLYIGRADSRNCHTVEASYSADDFTAPAEGGGRYCFESLRELYPRLGDNLFALAGRALQIHSWHKAWKFCPSCSGMLKDSETERAKECPSCRSMHYPVISPAVIVAVTKDDKILLAHNNRYPARKRYSILAGFVEPGESLEETVAREIEEEVNIKVKNIKYFGSQSWPFPHSLMVGFTAEYESGEIKADGVEISHADWFSADNLPEIPPGGSISCVLIEDFAERMKRKERKI